MTSPAAKPTVRCAHCGERVTRKHAHWIGDNPSVPFEDEWSCPPKRRERSSARSLKIAVDTCVGKRGRALLERAGHKIMVEADQGEMDHVWFRRALEAGVELVVSADSDLEVHCYDHKIEFFQAQQWHSGLLTAQRVLLRYPGGRS